jgi:hypothetical protein
MRSVFGFFGAGSAEDGIKLSKAAKKAMGGGNSGSRCLRWLCIPMVVTFLLTSGMFLLTSGMFGSIGKEFWDAPSRLDLGDIFLDCHDDRRG